MSAALCRHHQIVTVVLRSSGLQRCGESTLPNIRDAHETAPRQTLTAWAQHAGRPRPMAKTNVPDSLVVGDTQILTNAKPDTYDLRDLEYRPMLRPLAPILDARPEKGAFQVLSQDGQSCTGHAVATVVNTVLARQAKRLHLAAPELVSPYMLYRMARRYDEFVGEDDD